MRQREHQLAVLQAARERGAPLTNAEWGSLFRRDYQRVATAGRIPKAIKEQGSAAVKAYLLSRSVCVKAVSVAHGEDVLR